MNRIDLAEGHEELSDNILIQTEERAVELAFDALNLTRLWQTVWSFTAISAVYVLVLLGEGAQIQSALAGLLLVGNLLLLRARKAHWVERDPRQVAAAVLLVSLLMVQTFHLETGDGLGVWWALAPFLTLRFRLKPSETVALFAAQFALVVLRLFGQAILTHSSLPYLSALLFLIFAYLPGTGISLFLSRRYQARFLIRWNEAAEAHRDRLRMKQELEYAREIQLSMLPREAPAITWLDVAALSLPATEVGGDYYDYFHITDDEMVMVVGDVTGHGVASGLVLSGVRSSLNLLQDELDQPQQILTRLNTMLKKTSTPRMLMTLGIVVVDSANDRLRVATAGHPPVLLARPNGDVIEIGSGSCPLGALSNAGYEELSVDLVEGDVFLLYSDGLVEALNADGELYGWERLSDSLAAQVQRKTVKEIRDGLLRDVWQFKGDAAQLDDLTMVVARYCPDGCHTPS